MTTRSKPVADRRDPATVVSRAVAGMEREAFGAAFDRSAVEVLANAGRAAHCYSFPTMAALCTLNWAWAAHHARRPEAEIRRRLVSAAVRGLGFHTLLKPDAFRRDEHDFRILECAVLAGDIELAKRIAAACRPARRSSAKFYGRALCGVFAACLLGDPAAERKQCDALRAGGRWDHTHSPSYPLLRALVDRNAKRLAVETAKTTVAFEECASVWDAVEDKRVGRRIVRLDRLFSEMYWPHGEAAAIALAVRAGLEIEASDVWFPRRFITAWRRQRGVPLVG